MKLILSCVQGQQGETTIYNGFISVEDLKKIAHVDYYSGDDDKIDDGYQRDRNYQDITKFANHLFDSESICTNAIWLNDRNNNLVIKPAFKSKPNFVFITIDTDYSLEITDGQVRVLGLLMCLERYKKQEKTGNQKQEKMRAFWIPFTLTQLDKTEERRGFVDINNNARKVSPVHTAAILYQIGNIDGDTLLKNNDEKRMALIFGTMRRLNSYKLSPLYDMLILPSQNKYTKQQIKNDITKKRRRKITANSFLYGMRYTNIYVYLHDHYFQPDQTLSEKSEELARYLMNFWKPLKKITNEMWETPDHYAFFGAIGMISLLQLFAFLTTKIHKTGGKLTERAYSYYLHRIPFLSNKEHWYNTTGVKNNPPVGADVETMQDKHGASYARTLLQKMITELDISTHQERYSVSRRITKTAIAAK